VRNEGRIIRPLLFATRDDILEHAGAAGLRWREDASNATDAHRRNIIRHHLLPVVREKINPGIARTLLRTAEDLGELDQYLATVARIGLDQVTTRRTGEEMRLSCTHLLSFPSAIQDRMLQRAVQDYTGRHITAERVAALSGMLHKQAGRSVELGGIWMATRDADELVIHPSPDIAVYALPLTVGTMCTTPGGNVTVTLLDRPAGFVPRGGHGEYADAESTGRDGLVVRSWRDGDTLVPLGMSGHRNVSDLLNDAGLMTPAKPGHPVVTTADDRIIWVCGVRISNDFKVTDSTRALLHMTFQSSMEQRYGEAVEDQW
jgi:tRNA(Ile)-lysidine synthase